MSGWNQWQKTPKHGLFFRPVKINILHFSVITLCNFFFLQLCTAAERMPFLRGSQQKHVRCLRVHSPRGAGKKSKTSGSSVWKTRMAKIVSLLILVRETSFLTCCGILLYGPLDIFTPSFTKHTTCKPFPVCTYEYIVMVIIYKNRSLHQEQKFPPLQVVKSGKECCIHGGRGQQVRCQTWERNFCRGRCILGFFSL